MSLEDKTIVVTGGSRAWASGSSRPSLHTALG